MLLGSIELLATAPGGVARLRDLVLMLAVQGKLVPQVPGDEPAHEFLRKIHIEKSTLTAGRGAKVGVTGDQDLAAISGPFTLPSSWVWCRIGDIGRVVGGGTPKSDEPRFWAERGIPWLTPADLYGRKDKTISRGRRDLSSEGLASSSAQLLPAGTVLFSSRAPIGYVAIAANELATNQGFKSCVPYVNEVGEYLYWHLKQLAPSIDASASGTTFKEISGKAFSQVLIALPPLAEQSRIVARIEELMRLCDALEGKGRLADEQHARLTTALFDALANSESAHALADNWKLVAEHFDLLLDRPEAVDALEQTILQLAVRGLLVPQDPNDEPANGLLKKIRAEKDQLISEGKIKRDKTLPPINIDERPFHLPNGWEWVRFDELIHPLKPIAYGVLVPGPDVEDGVSFVRISDLSLTNPSKHPEKKISREVDAQFQRTRLEGGEILMGVNRPGI